MSTSSESAQLFGLWNFGGDAKTKKTKKRKKKKRRAEKALAEATLDDSKLPPERARQKIREYETANFKHAVVEPALKTDGAIPKFRSDQVGTLSPCWLCDGLMRIPARTRTVTCPWCFEAQQIDVESDEEEELGAELHGGSGVDIGGEEDIDRDIGEGMGKVDKVIEDAESAGMVSGLMDVFFAAPEEEKPEGENRATDKEAEQRKVAKENGTEMEKEQKKPRDTKKNNEAQGTSSVKTLQDKQKTTSQQGDGSDESTEDVEKTCKLEQMFRVIDPEGLALVDKSGRKAYRVQCGQELLVNRTKKGWAEVLAWGSAPTAYFKINDTVVVDARLYAKEEEERLIAQQEEEATKEAARIQSEKHAKWLEAKRRIMILREEALTKLAAADSTYV